MKYVIFLFLNVTLSIANTSAQCSGKASKLFQKAEQEISLNPHEAIDKLHQVINICPEYEKAIFLLVDLYIKNEKWASAIQVLKNYIKNTESPNSRVFYFLGLAQKNIQDITGSLSSFNKYINSQPKSTKLLKKTIENIELLQFRKKVYENMLETTFYPEIKINTDHSEYLPIITANENLMVFTRRLGRIEQAYFMTRNTDEVWTAPKPLSDIPKQFRKAAISMSADGNLLVFAMADNPRGLGGFDLYYMEKNRADWTRPINLGPYVNTAGWESQPCLSADGRTLYFSSDRKGGEGGHDIWKSKRNPDGTWSIPSNLGSEINTKKDEESPFIHRDQQTLYFRSNGHPGLGSFDIYMSRMLRFKKWEKPIHLGYPINSSGNDGSFFVSMDGKTAYIASNMNYENYEDFKNQKLIDQLDIYSFVLHEKYRPLATTYLNINFIDALSGDTINPFSTLVNFNSGDTIYYGKYEQTTLCLPGNETYALSTFLEGYQPFFERFDLSSSNWYDLPRHKTVRLHPLPKISPQASEPVILYNVLFEINSTKLLPLSIYELNQLLQFLNQNPDLHIAIHGHTDDVGTNETNLKLSTGRARSVYQYLVDQGIDKTRMTYEGFGESRAIADNSTEEGRALNRRTEFVVVRK